MKVYINASILLVVIGVSIITHVKARSPLSCECRLSVLMALVCIGSLRPVCEIMVIIWRFLNLNFVNSGLFVYPC